MKVLSFKRIFLYNILYIFALNCTIAIECDDKDIKAEYGCDWSCKEMARAGYCETGYSSSAPKCVLKSPIKNLCKKSCNICGIHFLNPNNYTFWTLIIIVVWC